MRLTCPNCQQAITLPDSAGGQTATCPLCNKEFQAPSLYGLAPEPEPRSSPPSFASPAPVALPPAPAEPPAPSAYVDAPPAVVPPPPAAPTISPTGASTAATLHLNRAMLEWLPAALLSVVLVLTFAKWDGAYPGGYRLYAQNAWQAMFGTFSVNPVSEKVFKSEADVKPLVKANWLMLLYLMGLIVAAAIAVADVAVPRFKLKLPAEIHRHWESRHLFLGVLCGLLLLLVVAQTWMGFGLGNGLEDYAEKTPTVVALRAEAKTDEERQVVEVQKGKILGQFSSQTTTWLGLVIAFHVIAAGSVALGSALRRRGARPDPRIDLIW
jgi:hypothetical protein